MSEKGRFPVEVKSTFKSILGGWAAPALATVGIIVFMTLLFVDNALPTVPAYPFLLANYNVALLLITGGLYGLRYKVTRYNFDLVVLLAIVAGLCFYVYGIGLTNQLILSNFNGDVVEKLDLLQHFSSILISIILIAGIYFNRKTQRIPLLTIIASFAIVIAAAILMMATVAGAYGMGGLKLDVYLGSLEEWLHVTGIVCCLTAATLLLLVRNWPYRNSVDGIAILLILQALSLLTASIDEGQFTLLWYVKDILLGQSYLFPFWGMVLDFLGSINQNNRLSLTLEDAGRWFLSTLSTGNRSYRPIETIARNFPESQCFSYLSNDNCTWTLEEHSPMNAAAEERPADRLELDLRGQNYLDGNTVITHNDADQGLSSAVRSLGNGFMLVTNKVGEDKYRLIGVRESGKVVWTQQEKRFVWQMANMYASSEIQRGIIEKRAHTISQMLAMIQTTRILTNVVEDGGQVLDDVVGALVEMLGYEGVSIWLLRGDGMLTATAWRWPDGMITGKGKGTVITSEGGVIGKAIKEKRAALVNDTERDDEYRNLFGEDTKSELAIPIIVDGRCYAVLDVQSSKRDAFEPLDQEVIATVSRLLSMSVNLRKLYADTRERGEIAEARNNLIAHDLRNILQALSTHVELIRMKGSRQAQGMSDIEENLKALKDGISNAHKFLEEVLTIVKLEAGKIGTIVEYDLIDIIRTSFNIIRESYPGKKVYLKLELEEKGGCRIRGTEFVKDVFMNLFSNSVKYSKGDETQIGITISGAGGQRGGLARVEVSDHGKGIEPARANEVFDRFNKGAGGTGLGLPLVRQIMQSIGGSVEIRERVPGDYTQGTTFVLTFPGAGMVVDDQLGFEIRK